jgi:DNA-directed RNA polymerase sigma subunit (sigma70/sigma32)
MLSERRKRKIKSAIAARDRAKLKLAETEEKLEEELWDAKTEEKASYSELGTLLGVSRQRAHQIVKGR